MIYDCIIVGAGPAGIAAAIQLKRAGLSLLLFEKGEVGGLLRNANLVENYLGFADGISGKELIKIFQKQIEEQEISLQKEEVVDVSKIGTNFIVQTSQDSYESNTVIIATGTRPKTLGIDGEESLHGSKLFYEIADFPKEEKDKKVLVVGGGDIGFDFAIQLKDMGHAPTIITRGEVQCLPLLATRARELDIPVFCNTTPEKICKDGENIAVQCDTNNFETDYILIAVGREPRYPRLPMQHHEGLYQIGDVQNKHLRQVHIATGDALRTAMDIISSVTQKTKS
jgi:thioredoxin reductase